MRSDNNDSKVKLETNNLQLGPDLYALKISEICTIKYAFMLLFCRNIPYKIKKCKQ
jgi:hypothetical protein